jgi:hypothetical protein
MSRLRVGLGSILCLLVVGTAVAAEGPECSSADDVRAVLEEVALDVSGDAGQFIARYRNVRVLVHANEQHDRLRIMTPVAAAHDMPLDELRVLLEANYGRALDARYAIGEGAVWALFNRPLEGLDRETFLDGVDQVVNLKKNFGTSYRSTDLTFGRLP